MNSDECRSAGGRDIQVGPHDEDGVGFTGHLDLASRLERVYVDRNHLVAGRARDPEGVADDDHALRAGAHEITRAHRTGLRIDARDGAVEEVAREQRIAAGCDPPGFFTEVIARPDLAVARDACEQSGLLAHHPDGAERCDDALGLPRHPDAANDFARRGVDGDHVPGAEDRDPGSLAPCAP